MPIKVQNCIVLPKVAENAVQNTLREDRKYFFHYDAAVFMMI